MLSTFLSVVHVVVSLLLILVVLLQQGKMGGLGAMGGSTSQQVFGGRGAGNLLTRLTGTFAAIFMATSLTLAYLASAGDIKLRKGESASNPHSLPSAELPSLPAPPQPAAPDTPTPSGTSSAP